MTSRLKRCPLIASVQASPKSPVDHPDTLLRLAKASIQEGVEVLRLEGVKNIRVIKPETPAPVIGLIKRQYPKSDVYITPTLQDADALIELGCEIVATDATLRERPKNATFAKLVAHLHRRDTLVMADCDTLESALAAAEAGADVIGTTLAGYTGSGAPTAGPDLELLRAICRSVNKPVVAEGRYTERAQIEAALRIGAVGVVVGGALNDPAKQTRALRPARFRDGLTGAVDIGGTWLRFGTFTTDWKLQDVDRTPNPKNREKCLEWIQEKVKEAGVHSLGVGTGGVVDPKSGEVWTAKEYLMPDHIGIVFSEATIGIPVHAFGDGHASAWGHANLPEFAGRRVATLAIGTGLGCGFVQSSQIWAGRRGEYPRVNDLHSPLGSTFEDLLGGLNLTATPSEEHKKIAIAALKAAVQGVRDLFFPDDLVICGSVGLSDWLAPTVGELGLVPSPFGHDAGLYGAAALAMYPNYLS